MNEPQIIRRKQPQQPQTVERPHGWVRASDLPSS
jgi:hypothetical protein